MTPEQYWHGDAWLYAAYREAKRREDEDRDWAQWAMGLYVYEAIQLTSPLVNPLSKRKEAYDWLDAPFGRSRAHEEERTGKDEEAVHQRMIDWVMSARVRR